jgi:uncharacterized membrane protein YgcG
MKQILARISLAALIAGNCGYANSQTPEIVSVPVLEVTSTSPNRINALHQHEWVRLDDNGMILGTLSVLNEDGQSEGRVGAKVVISRDGRAVLETISDEGGRFELAGLKPGTYAIQCGGDYTFAANALHVLPADAKHLSTELSICASVIPARRVSELLNGLMVPPELANAQDVYYRDFSKDPLGEKREFNDSHKVSMRDGTLVGRVSRPGWTFDEQDLSGTIAQIVREGVVVAKAPVGSDGFYSIENLAPGVYDLFVSGDDGFAVLSFEAVEVGAVAAKKSTSPKLISAQTPPANCLSCEMIYQPEKGVWDMICTDCTPPGEMPISPPAPAPAPVAGGGYAGPGGFGGPGGGGAGGGGFGGGGAGLGGLLGIAGLAVGVTALSDDDGFNANQASLIAP